MPCMNRTGQDIQISNVYTTGVADLLYKSMPKDVQKKKILFSTLSSTYNTSSTGKRSSAIRWSSYSEGRHLA